jgi:hypothetical protein
MVEPIDQKELHERLSATTGELYEIFWDRSRDEVLYKSENEDLNKYTPLEILIILQHAAEIFAERVIRMIKDEQIPFTRDYDEDKILKKVDLNDESVRANLRSFTDSRSKLFRTLFTIDNDQWDLIKIKHEIHGEITLRQLLSLAIIMEEDLKKKAVTILKEYDEKTSI